MKIYNFYAVDFSCYRGINVRPNINLDHCQLFPLDCNTEEEAKSLLRENQVLLKSEGVFKDGKINKVSELVLS